MMNQAIHKLYPQVISIINGVPENSKGKDISSILVQKDIDAEVARLTNENVWQDIRHKRDGLLAACDWTQMPDAPLAVAKVSAWKAYRQDLRDITIQAYPTNIVWPAIPV